MVKGKRPLNQTQFKYFQTLVKHYTEDIVQKWIDYFGKVVGDVANLFKKASFPSYQDNPHACLGGARQSRLGVTGFLHYIMAFGIERRNILHDDTDRDEDVRRITHFQST